MTTEETLVSVLKKEGINAYPIVKAQSGALPCVVYKRIDTKTGNTQNGKGLDRAWIQLFCVDGSYKGAKELSDKVLGLLDRNCIDFVGCQMVNRFDDFNGNVGSAEVGYGSGGEFEVVMDFWVLEK